MTRKRVIEGESPFGQWLRLQTELDSRLGYDGEDLDLTWHHYIKGFLMLLEIKCFRAVSSYAQRDTHSILDQALTLACNLPNFSFNRLSAKRPKRIKYFGYHLVQFERTSPDDGRIWIDGIEVTREMLVMFLKFEWTPGTKQKDIRIAS